MRLFFVSLSLLVPSATAFSAYQQQLIPILREIKNLFSALGDRMEDLFPHGRFRRDPLRVLGAGGGTPERAPALGAGIKTVDLSVHNESIRFPYDSTRVWIDGRPHRCSRATVKNQEGFWVR